MWDTTIAAAPDAAAAMTKVWSERLSPPLPLSLEAIRRGY
jgi:hypothetical protein